MNSEFSKIMTQILMAFAKSYKEFEGFDFPPLHDPNTVAYAIDPSIYEVNLIN